MTNQDDLKITAMPTPNPNSVKFSINRVLLERGTIDFAEKEKAASSPLPKALFDVKGIIGVMVGTQFVSIVKEQESGWEDVLEPSTKIITEMLNSGETLLDKELVDSLDVDDANDSDTVKKIKEILDNEIRPAIAMDGGDCMFHSFEEGILTLQLQGACSTCPASIMTLKMGIENRLKEDIPDLKEVVQLS